MTFTASVSVLRIIFTFDSHFRRQSISEIQSTSFSVSHSEKEVAVLGNNFSALLPDDGFTVAVKLKAIKSKYTCVFVYFYNFLVNQVDFCSFKSNISTTIERTAMTFVTFTSPSE